MQWDAERRIWDEQEGAGTNAWTDGAASNADIDSAAAAVTATEGCGRRIGRGRADGTFESADNDIFCACGEMGLHTGTRAAERRGSDPIVESAEFFALLPTWSLPYVALTSYEPLR